MIKMLIIAALVFVSMSAMVDSRHAPARSITERIAWMMPSDITTDVADLFIAPADAQVSGTSTAFLASIYFILFAAWDHFIDGIRPAKINGLASDSIENVNGLVQ